MHEEKKFEVIIIGGSYAGLSAAMALGRALKKVLVIDSGKPCNRQTPLAHNFITHDGRKPEDIAAQARYEVGKYSKVTFFEGYAVSGRMTESGFEISAATGENFSAGKLILATGLEDEIPDIPGYADCWGISVLHCPYCHGYEVAGQPTGILGNGVNGFDLAVLISNWTNSVTLFTNGPSTLNEAQAAKLLAHDIQIVEEGIEKFHHQGGQLEAIVHTDLSIFPIKVLYARFPVKQHSAIAQLLGCEITSDGYVLVDEFQETTVNGVYACGDNSNRVRTLSNAVASGTTAGMTISKRRIAAEF